MHTIKWNRNEIKLSSKKSIQLVMSAFYDGMVLVTIMSNNYFFCIQLTLQKLYFNFFKTKKKQAKKVLD